MKERDERIKKLKELLEKGIKPYGEPFKESTPISDLRDKFLSLEGSCQKISGRIVGFRDHGGSSFVDILDDTGKIQCYFQEKTLGVENYQTFKKLVDIGDFLGLEGILFKTKRGEITLEVIKWVFLTKAIRPLPEKWHGLRDIEQRYRLRYLDLIVNPKVKEDFVVRSKILEKIRRFLNDNGFIEVETPILQPIAGGANANPFVTYHQALNKDLYLRIAPELYLKRLVVGGIYKVFEVSKNFRNEGISKVHNPEFTMLEVYWAFQDHRSMMKLTEDMIHILADSLLPQGVLSWEGKEINLKKEFVEIEYRDLFYKTVGIDMETLKDLSLAKKYLDEMGIELSKPLLWENVVDEIFDEIIEPKLIEPTFVTGYPVQLSPLAKERESNPEYTDRFELFIRGMEIANGFSELNNPFVQRERFEEQLKKKERGDKEAHVFDEDYILALEYGLPPTGGLGIGIDRLCMIFLGLSSIRDVILFPQLKTEVNYFEIE